MSFITHIFISTKLLNYKFIKLKDFLACAATGMILCTSCIKNEAPNAEADILNCTLPEGILTDAIINYNAPFDGEINAYPLRLEVHNGTDLTQLAPTFELTPGATITPANGSTQNFTRPVRYSCYGFSIYPM